MRVSESTFRQLEGNAHDVSETRDGEDLRQWSWLEIEIGINTFRQSTIPQKQFIIIIIIITIIIIIIIIICLKFC